MWAFLMQENVEAEIHLAMKTICLFHNATLFFSLQRSQDGPFVKWLRDPNVRGVARSLGCGATVRAACGRGLAAQLGACIWEKPQLLAMWSVCVQRPDYVLGAQYAQVAVRSGKGNPVIGPESLRCRCSIASKKSKCAIAIIALACYSSG